MKKKHSPIKLSGLSFTSYDRYLPGNPCRCLGGFDFGSEHDFLIDDDFAGIAVELRFSNLLYHDGKGTRRKVSLLLFDESNGYLICSRKMCVSIPAILSKSRIVAVFPNNEINYGPRTPYSIEVRDDNADVLLGEGHFHTYDIFLVGHPSKWYQPLAAGIIVENNNRMMKSYDAYAEPARDCSIRFEISDCMPGLDFYNIPSLKVHINYPHHQFGEGALIEPTPSDRVCSSYFVDYPLYGLTRYRGIYYVELFCMDSLIAGFVFANDTDIEGAWTGDDLIPLAKY